MWQVESSTILAAPQALSLMIASNRWQQQEQKIESKKNLNHSLKKKGKKRMENPAVQAVITFYGTLGTLQLYGGKPYGAVLDTE